jgi:four helix bundle protein
MNDQSFNAAKTIQEYDLEERTAKLAEAVIDLLKRFPRNSINDRLVGQCIRSAESIRANYCEANEAESKTDFIHKISICKKETKEIKHWLRLLARANSYYKNKWLNYGRQRKNYF